MTVDRGRRASRVRWPGSAGRVPVVLATALVAAFAVPALAGAPASAAPAAYRAAAGRATAPGRATALVRAAPAKTPAKTTVRGWGTDDDGDLGNGSTGTFRDTPVKVKVPSGSTITSVRAGCDHSLALTSAGGALAWGNNSQGQLGDGTATNRLKPVPVKLPKGTKLTAVRAGCLDSIALTSTGHVLAWGYNANGELGDGKANESRKPVQVKLPRGVKAKSVTAGCYHNLALTTTGKLYAWGENIDGQLGDGTTTDRHTPVRVKLPAGITATSVAAGCQFSLMVANTGDMYVWGDNTYGQLGTGNTASTSTPTLLVFLIRGQPIGTVTGLFAGCRHTIALFSKGAVFAWGDDSFGQLGNGTNTGSDKPTGVMIPAGTTVKSVSAGCFDSYALTSQGTVLAWGDGEEGQLGNGNTSNANLPVSVSLPTNPGVASLGVGPGAQHAFVVSPSSSGG